MLFRSSESERDDHPERRDGGRRANVAAEEREVDFKTYEEEEQHEADGRDEVEKGDRGSREDGLGEAGDASCEAVSRRFVQDSEKTYQRLMVR